MTPLCLKLVIALLAGAASGFVPFQSTKESVSSPQLAIDPLRMTTTKEQQQDDKMPMGSPTIAISPSLSPLESWCIIHMELWYSQSLSIKCPFFRRRMADLLDATDMMMRFVVIRHKSLDLIGPPPGCRSTKSSNVKHSHLALEALCDTIRRDWREDTLKGYYITGRLNTTIYRDDCLFDGPDPDMPVRGLRKYLNAASHLFDYAKSDAELLSLDVVSDSTIVARWKLRGVLHLPWRPQLPVWTGSTTYHFDENRLVHLHEETWDISVLEAFTETLFPDVAHKIWNRDSKQLTGSAGLP
jgi:hypothetical protein